MKTRSTRLIAHAAILATVLSIAPLARAGVFTPISGYIAPQPILNTSYPEYSLRPTATAVSADGSVITGTTDSTVGSYTRGWIWNGSPAVVPVAYIFNGTVGSQQTQGSYPTGINGAGTLIIGSNKPDSGTPASAAWNAAGDKVSLNFNGQNPTARGVSADGNVVFGVSGVSGDFPTINTTILPRLPVPYPGATPSQLSYFNTTLNGANADGSVVVGTERVTFQGSPPNGFPPSFTHPFRWTQATGTIPVELPGGATEGRAIDVDLSGTHITGTVGTQTYLWTNGSASFIPNIPGATFQTPTAISGDGSIIVGMANFTPFLWTQSLGTVILQSLLLADNTPITGWTLLTVNDISADGSTVVGSALDPTGKQFAYAAKINTAIPEPSLLTLLTLPALTLKRRRA